MTTWNRNTHGFSLPIDRESIAGYAAATGKLLNIPDVYKLSPTKRYRFSKQFDLASGYVTRSMLTIPLLSSKRDILVTRSMLTIPLRFLASWALMI